MLFILVTVCCVISVCLIISHSVSLSALSAIPPSPGQAGSQSRESRQPLSGRDWDLSRPDPALAANTLKSGGTN